MNTITVAKALVIDDAQNCLILRRSDTHPHVPLKPDLPGGQLDGDESSHQAVVREILEETGLSVDPAQTHLVYAGSDVDRGRNRIHMIYVTHVAGTKPTVQISWEHSEAWWTPLGNVASELTNPGYVTGIRYLEKHGILQDLAKE